MDSERNHQSLKLIFQQGSRARQNENEEKIIASCRLPGTRRECDGFGTKGRNKRIKCQRDSRAEKELPTEKEQTHPISGSETVLFARVPLKERDHIDRNDVGLWIAWQTDGDKSSPSPRPRSTEKKRKKRIANERARTCLPCQQFIENVQRQQIRNATRPLRLPWDFSSSPPSSWPLLDENNSSDKKNSFRLLGEKLYLSLPLLTIAILYFPNLARVAL